MAISTYNTILYEGKTESDMTKLVDISSFPKLIGDPNLLDVTTLSDASQQQIFGINQSDKLDFNFFYDGATYAAVAARGYDETAEDNPDHFYAIKFGDGSGFTWKGIHQCTPNDGDVDSPVEATVSILVHSKPQHKAKLTIGG